MLALRKAENPLAQPIQLRLPRVDRTRLAIAALSRSAPTATSSSSSSSALALAQGGGGGSSGTDGSEGRDGPHRSGGGRSAASRVSDSESSVATAVRPTLGGGGDGQRLPGRVTLAQVAPAGHRHSPPVPGAGHPLPASLRAMAHLAAVTCDPTDTPAASAAKCLVVEEHLLDFHLHQRATAFRAPGAASPASNAAWAEAASAGAGSRKATADFSADAAGAGGPARFAKANGSEPRPSWNPRFTTPANLHHVAVKVPKDATDGAGGSLPVVRPPPFPGSEAGPLPPTSLASAAVVPSPQTFRKEPSPTQAGAPVTEARPAAPEKTAAAAAAPAVPSALSVSAAAAMSSASSLSEIRLQTNDWTDFPEPTPVSGGGGHVLWDYGNDFAPSDDKPTNLQ